MERDDYLSYTDIYKGGSSIFRSYLGDGFYEELEKWVNEGKSATKIEQEEPEESVDDSGNRRNENGEIFW